MRTINLNAKSQEMKTLNAFMKEPNEFKRYLLCQMWIVQLFTETITEPINKHSKPATSNGGFNQRKHLQHISRH